MLTCSLPSPGASNPFDDDDDDDDDNNNDDDDDEDVDYGFLLDTRHPIPHSFPPEYRFGPRCLLPATTHHRTEAMVLE